jgi:hypothetical protein
MHLFVLSLDQYVIIVFLLLMEVKHSRWSAVTLTFSLYVIRIFLLILIALFVSTMMSLSVDACTMNLRTLNFFYYLILHLDHNDSILIILLRLILYHYYSILACDEYFSHFCGIEPIVDGNRLVSSHWVCAVVED